MPKSTFLDWTSEFATSIDESAWFLLLFMFELETYALDDAAWKGWVARIVHGVRVICYVMLAHTIYAYTDSVIKLAPTVPVKRHRVCATWPAPICPTSTTSSTRQ